jgi:hypothetical protein
MKRDTKFIFESVKNLITNEEVKFRTKLWKENGDTAAQQVVWANEIFSQANAAKTFEDFANINDIFPDGDGYERIIEALDKL